MAVMIRFGKVLVVLAAAFVLIWSVSAAPRATSPATASAPTSKPAAKYPSDELVRSCDRAAKAMLKRVDRTFASVVRPPFIVIGNMPKRTLARHAQGSVVAPAEVLWKTYFERKPDKPVTILLLRDDKTYRAWAKTLFGDTDVSHYGYYKPDVRTMVMNIATGGGTLVHELTHALIVYDFPAVPDWFNEGLGSLHEQCSIRPTGIVGLVNWRLPGLQKAIRDKKLRPLRDLVTKDDFYGARRGVNYAQARYFVMYMQQRGVLGKFYKQHRGARGAEAAPAVKTIERAFGERLDTIEPAFVRWAAGLRRPR